LCGSDSRAFYRSLDDVDCLECLRIAAAELQAIITAADETGGGEGSD
jgi:hypothetical protein